MIADEYGLHPYSSVFIRDKALVLGKTETKNTFLP